mmetsp:Transcript_39659/g.82421  ORF Transcript_39659/g.82421 Transcript_39659/m.82421 type:complete len:97 (-) Transcript_39659:436-726(-)
MSAVRIQFLHLYPDQGLTKCTHREKPPPRFFELNDNSLFLPRFRQRTLTMRASRSFDEERSTNRDRSMNRDEILLAQKDMPMRVQRNRLDQLPSKP